MDAHRAATSCSDSSGWSIVLSSKSRTVFRKMRLAKRNAIKLDIKERPKMTSSKRDAKRRPKQKKRRIVL